MWNSLAAVLLAALPQDTVRVEARFVDLAGEPLAGVTLSAEQFPNVAPARSGPDGAVALEIQADLRDGARLLAVREGYVARRWLLREPARAKLHDLGELVLDEGGTVTGRVVDARGERLLGEWSIVVRGQVEQVVGAPVVVGPGRASARVDPASGEFRVEGAPSGRVRVSARHPWLHVGTEEIEFSIEPGVETFVELPYRGPDPSRSLRVKLALLGAAPRSMPPLELRLVDGAGDEHRLTANLRRSGSERMFVDVGPPPFTVTHDDPRFEAVRVEGLAGGASTTLDLVGSCAYRLDLRERGSGRRPTRAGLTLVRGDERTEVLAPNSPILPGQLIAGVFPGEELSFELLLPGRTPLLRKAPTPRPGVVPWTLSVDPPRSLLLELVDAQGGACANVEVQVTQGTLAGTTGSPHRVNGVSVPAVDHVATSDREGRVSLGNLHATTHTIRVFFGPCLVFEDTLSSAQLDVPQRIVEPVHGALSVEVLLPEPAQRAAREGRLKLRVHPHGRLGSAAVGEFGLGELPLEVSLPPGEATVLATLTAPGTRRGRTWQLASAEVRAGETSALALDLRETCPGSVDLRVTVNGRTERTRFRGSVTAHLPGRDEPVLFEALVTPQLHSTLAPGEYHVDLRADDGAWEVAERLTLEPGGHLERRLDFAIHTTTLELRDAATGRPLARRELALERTRFGHTWRQVATTDEHGRVRLRLVAGAAEVQVDGHAPGTIDADGSEGPLVVRMQAEAPR